MDQSLDKLKEIQDSSSSDEHGGFGLQDIDANLGCIRKKELAVITGNRFTGKSTLCRMVLESQLKNNRPTAYFSLRKTIEELMLEILNIPKQKIKKGRVDQNYMFGKKIKKKLKKLKRNRIFVNDSNNLDIDELVKEIVMLYEEHSIETIIIDDFDVLSATGREVNSCHVSSACAHLRDYIEAMNVSLIISLNKTGDNRDNWKRLNEIIVMKQNQKYRDIIEIADKVINIDREIIFDGVSVSHSHAKIEVTKNSFGIKFAKSLIFDEESNSYITSK